MALLLFDVMKKYHGLDGRDRLLLQIAAIIHGCGKFISTRNTSASAYNIIMATEIIGLSHQERELVANVVRSRGEEFDYVGDDTKVAKLTALLRLANDLDRSHKQKTSVCRMAVKGGELVITAGYDGDISLELLAVSMAADFFEEIFGIRPVLKKKGRG
jgi:exopolyphosphatase/guanosine-5'-triphosphate,3'-diphosphate pyrophosphatase